MEVAQMNKMAARKVLLLILVALLIPAAIALAISYEGPTCFQSGRLARLEPLGVRGLGQAHAILRSADSLLVKAEAMGIIERIGDESSIPALIREFGYRGRWWMRWHYQEEQGADGWRSIAAGAVRGFGTVADSYLRSSLSDPDEWVRYWSLVTLTELPGFDDWDLVQELANSDRSATVRCRAEDILTERSAQLRKP